MEKKKKDVRNCKRRILIVDDYLWMLRAMVMLINADSKLKVGAVASNVAQALNAIDNQSFDLAVVDIMLEGANGLELTKVMKSQCPDMPVVIFSSHDELSFVKHAFQAGASGYVEKSPDTIEEIFPAIHKVLDGGTYISQRITKKLSANDIEEISTACTGDVPQ